MRGTAKIINSATDAEQSTLTRDQIIERATISVRRDITTYPNDYDTTLKEGDDGFIEPEYIFEDEIDQAVLVRFGIEL